MQKHRTGFSTLMLALSIGRRLRHAAANAEPRRRVCLTTISFSPPRRQVSELMRPIFRAPSQSGQRMWAPSADDSNAHMFLLLQYVGAIDGDGQQDYLLI